MNGSPAKARVDPALPPIAPAAPATSRQREPTTAPTPLANDHPCSNVDRVRARSRVCQSSAALDLVGSQLRSPHRDRPCCRPCVAVCEHCESRDAASPIVHVGFPMQRQSACSGGSDDLSGVSLAAFERAVLAAAHGFLRARPSTEYSHSESNNGTRGRIKYAHRAAP